MLSDLRYTEGTNDEEWITIKRALKESILETLEQRGLVIFFNESTNQLLNAMKNEIERPRLDVPVKFSDPEFTINTISLLENQLVVDGALGASASYISRDASFDTVAQADVEGALPGTPQFDPAVQRIQNQVDSLIRQIEGLEQKLSQFRRILNN